jgi:hypothetical protein
MLALLMNIDGAITANKELEDIASRTVEGVLDLSKMKDLWLNRPEDTDM